MTGNTSVSPLERIKAGECRMSKKGVKGGKPIGGVPAHKKHQRDTERCGKHQKVFNKISGPSPGGFHRRKQKWSE
jgi:hypothetical protein